MGSFKSRWPRPLEGAGDMAECAIRMHMAPLEVAEAKSRKTRTLQEAETQSHEGLDRSRNAGLNIGTIRPGLLQRGGVRGNSFGLIEP